MEPIRQLATRALDFWGRPQPCSRLRSLEAMLQIFSELLVLLHAPQNRSMVTAGRSFPDVVCPLGTDYHGQLTRVQSSTSDRDPCQS